MTSICQLSRNGSSKTLEEPFVKVEILRRDCPSRSPHFNPLHPCGRRPWIYNTRRDAIRFQSTPPVWAKTKLIPIFISDMRFQSTPPVWAKTVRSTTAFLTISLFQSTPPVWAETESDCSLSYCLAYFNPLRPCGRRPMFDTCNRLDYDISIHSARVGGDTCGRST